MQLQLGNARSPKHLRSQRLGLAEVWLVLWIQAKELSQDIPWLTPWQVGQGTGPALGLWNAPAGFQPVNRSWGTF